MDEVLYESLFVKKTDYKNNKENIVQFRRKLQSYNYGSNGLVMNEQNKVKTDLNWLLLLNL